MEDLAKEHVYHWMVRRGLNLHDSVENPRPAYANRLSLAEGLWRRPGMQRGYSLWIGQPVVLRVATGDQCVPLCGVILNETDDAVRFRIGDGWDVHIYKNMVLAVEEQDQTGTIN